MSISLRDDKENGLALQYDKVNGLILRMTNSEIKMIFLRYEITDR